LGYLDFWDGACQRVLEYIFCSNHLRFLERIFGGRKTNADCGVAMKTPEDEAFDDLARRQGAWGGGFQAKRQAAMDKVNAEFYEEYIKYRTAFPKGYTTQQVLPKDYTTQQRVPLVEYCTDYHCARDCGQPHDQKEMRDFFTSQPAQEPVAFKHMMLWVHYLKRPSDFGQHMNIPSGFSAGDCWELANELERFIKNQLKREWVGLTDEDRKAVLLTAYKEWECEELLLCAREDYLLIEQALKEKNT
jgi:hypothetical protein